MFFAKPLSYIPSSSTVGLLIHLQYYQRFSSMILKMWVKSKFVLCQPRYNLLTEKKYKSNNVTVLKKFLSSSNSINLMEDLIRWNKGFEIQ